MSASLGPGFPWQMGDVPRDKVTFPRWALSPSLFWVPDPLLSKPHLGGHHWPPEASPDALSVEDADSVRPSAGLLGSGASLLHLEAPTQAAETQEVGDGGGNDSSDDNSNNTLGPTKWLQNTL